ncbi:hypothetical protein NKY66_10655 [Sinorhizobium meliloti]|uniref:hypothetical protein n=1 Tax=Rhizobium meliloti TaxID=382 RepID=UPI003D64F542
MSVARPTMPLHLSSVKAEEAAELITQFKEWFGRNENRDLVKSSAQRTRAFLLEYDHTPTLQGGIGDAEPWVKLEDVPLPRLQETEDEIRLDLRLSGLRVKTFCAGACRMIGILNETNALPKFANSYNDASTNLAEWFLHERLMRSYLKSKASGENPDTIGSAKLSDLLGLYMYEQGAQQGAVRAKIVQMVSVGLWDADPPVGAREWKIRAGPVATEFHLEVFVSVVEHFKQYLRGSQEPSKEEDNGLSSNTR